MGQTAIRSHAKYKKHKENAIIAEKNPRLNFAAPAKTIARDTAQPRSDVFAKKFCAHRWVENVSLMERTDAPVEPFLFGNLSLIIWQLLKCILKPSVMPASIPTAKLMKANLSKNSEDLRPIPDIDIGEYLIFNNFTYYYIFCLQHKQDLEQQEQYPQSKKISSNMICINIILCRCKLIPGLSALQPMRIANSLLLAEGRISVCLNCLLEHNRILLTVADLATLINSPAFIESLNEFDETRDRLDVFWINWCNKSSTTFNSKSDALSKVVKQLLILSHGNATVESGFIVNEDLLVENLQEKSIIAQRLVYDFV
uniref:Uncharacterized protein n=1 Tax=Romanomermis culicivorax TaxID=13658 RepID=A0A915JXD8_ROMCU